jgi:hypothetical protein
MIRALFVFGCAATVISAAIVAVTRLLAAEELDATPARHPVIGKDQNVGERLKRLRAIQDA